MQKNYINKNKLSCHPDRVAKFLNNEAPNPITAKIYLTDKCCFKCFYCTRKNKDYEIEQPQLTRLLHRLKELNVKGIILSGGEPVLYQNLNYSLLRMKEIGNFDIGITTSLVLLHEQMLSIPHWVRVSVDSVIPETYKKIRGSDRLSDVLSNLRIMKAHKEPGVVLGAQMVLSKLNLTAKEIDAFMEQMIPLVDYVHLKPVESHPVTKYSDKQLKLLEQYKLQATVSDKFFHQSYFKKCSARWAQISVDTDFNVLCCCSKREEKVGSVFDHDILEKMKAYQTDMRTCPVPCVHTSNNLYLEGIVNANHRNFI